MGLEAGASFVGARSEEADLAVDGSQVTAGLDGVERFGENGDVFSQPLACGRDRRFPGAAGYQQRPVSAASGLRAKARTSAPASASCFTTCPPATKGRWTER